MYQKGKECRVLDCIKVQIIKGCGTDIQPENFLINRECYFEKLDTYSLREVLKIHKPEFHKYILGKNAGHYVRADYIKNAGGISLVLVKVNCLKIYNNENHKTKADFKYNLQCYKKFSVTDKEYYDKNKEINSAYLIISLPGKSKHDKYFKCIAKIFECCI